MLLLLHLVAVTAVVAVRGSGNAGERVQAVEGLAGAVVVCAAVGVGRGGEAEGAAEERAQGGRAGGDYAYVELQSFSYHK